MIRFLAVSLSTVVMGGLVYRFGAIVLIGLPLIVLAILFGELGDHASNVRPHADAKAADLTTDF